MFDKNKLEAFLDALEVETHYPSEAPKKIIAAPQSALDAKMDKYDIFKQPGYQNVGTMEFPLWAKIDLGSITMESLQNAYGAAMYGSYAGINRTPFWATPMRVPPLQYATWDTTAVEDDPPPVETPHQKLQKQVAALQGIASVKLSNPNPKPLAPTRSPDFVGAITAWRGWGVEDGELVALGSDFIWLPRQASRAKCMHEHHAAPQMGCSCGFWSFKTMDAVTEAMANYMADVKVIGTVEIWGRVIECTNGWRSEYAYPKELWLLEEGLEALSWTYGVPVKQHVEPRALVKEGPKAR